MFDLEFANPSWIHAIWVVVAMAALFVVLEVRKKRGDQLFVQSKMQKRLARTSSLSSRFASHLFWVLAMACFVLALMRPQYGFMEKKVPHVGAQIMICLDVSKSMLAEDASPNRLERAKSELEVLLNYLKGDQVGLVAFAGQASVLCPMTTDYGYLKMLLRETTTTSVGKGGTMLEAPIRRAMAGFSDNREMSNVIILITDGEDNGSKPLDAAKEAAERGIKIITIGFGHERGSKIEITDPRTGLTSYVQDPSGQDVVSRLDLDLLTKIATATQGACIPARVGSLDVETIHRDHIRPLMRSTGETKLVVRNEAFQWPLLAGIVLIFLAILTSNSLAFSRTSFSDWLLSHSTVRIAPIFLLLWLSNPVAAQVDSGPTAAQQKREAVDQKRDQDKSKKESDSTGLGSEFSSRTIEEVVPDDPIECYNLSVDVLQSNPEYAEKLLEAARRDAGDNADLRYRSSYNLGWSKVYQANANLEEKPEDALRQLNGAADWFRESVRLRPKNESARQNLEIILRRIAELNDSLNKSDPASFQKQLDELIERQTTMVQTSRRLLQQSAASQSGLVSDEMRKAFRLASVDQRLLNSDLQETARQATQRLEEFQRKQNDPTAQTSNNDPQQQMEMAQLAVSLDYVNRASQRLGQARSQLRLRNARRASLRGALGLDELKRARDQLRNPAEILRQIIADSQLLQQQTAALVAGENRLAAFLGNQTHLPEWLDTEYLTQFQTTQVERTDELAAVLQAILKNQQSQNSAGDVQEAEQTLTESMRSAGVLVATASIAFKQARAELSDNRARKAPPHQLKGIQALLDAYELFADLKGLLELSYNNQVEVNRNLPAASNLQGNVLQQAAESLKQQAMKNPPRLKRIVALISKQLAETQNQTNGSQPGAPPTSQGTNANGTQANREQELERLRYAQQLAEKVATDTDAFVEKLNNLTQDDSSDFDWPSLEAEAESLENGLMELRRLFFSIVEHLKETLTRQQQLNSDTDQELAQIESDQATSSAEQQSTKTTEQNETKGQSANEKKVDKRDFSSLKPLASRQAELASVADQIGNGLRQMAENMGQQIQPGDPGTNQNQQIMKNYAEASQLVQAGKSSMDKAAANIEKEETNSADLSEQQSVAVSKLAEALRLLEPPQNDQQDDQNSQSNQPENQPDQGDNSNQSLLQRIRDLEAQRRKNRNRQPFPERVEKDW